MLDITSRYGTVTVTSEDNWGNLLHEFENRWLLSIILTHFPAIFGRSRIGLYINRKCSF